MEEKFPLQAKAQCLMAMVSLLVYFQGHQVRDDVLQFLVSVSFMLGMSRPSLIVTGPAPRPGVFRLYSPRRRAQGLTTHQMGKVRTKPPRRFVSLTV